MNLSDEEKRELLEFLYRFYYAWFTNNDGVLEDEARDAYRDIHALIEAPPPKYTMCENCLDDLEDEDNKFCYDDKCWQKLLDDCEAAEADLKKARPRVDEKFITEWAFNLAEEAEPSEGRKLKYATWQAFIRAMLQEAGVEIKEEERPIQYRCEGCGATFRQRLFTHGRSVIGKDGHSTEVGCGPITKVEEANPANNPDKVSGKEGDMQNATNNVANRIREKT
jgi:hypothetical protein